GVWERGGKTKNGTTIMKPTISITKPLLRTLFRRFKPLRAIAAAGLLLGGPGAASRADILYLSNGANDTIEKFTSGGVGSVFASTGLNIPYSLAFDSAGNLYVANAGNSTIEKFTSGGAGSVFSNGIGVLSSPGGLAFDNAGNLYAANAGSNTIEKFTSGG